MRVATAILLFAFASFSFAERFADGPLGPGVSRQGRLLVVRAKNGAKVEFANNDVDNSDVVLFSYFEFLKPVEFHVIRVQYYENAEFIMVARKDGARYFLPGRPRVSPKRDLILGVAASESGGKNGVFLYRLRYGILEPEFWFEPEEYALYEFISWNDDGSIGLKKFARMPNGDCGRDGLAYIPVLLRPQNEHQGKYFGPWQLQPDLKSSQCR